MATTTIAATRIESPSSRLIAPWWHTALLIALFLGLAVGGAFFQRRARAEPGMLQQHPQVVPLYLSLIAMEWGLFVWVWRGGLRKTGTKLRELIGGKWASAKDVLVDCGLALGLWSAWTLAELAWNRGFGVGHAALIQTFLPRRGLEILLWWAVPSAPDSPKSWSFAVTFRNNSKLLHTVAGLRCSYRLSCSGSRTVTRE